MRARLFVTSLAVNVLLWFILFGIPVSGLTSKLRSSERRNAQNCYLCLPIKQRAPTANKTLALDIRYNIPTTCASLTSKSLHEYVFHCPTQYVNCFQRIKGKISIGSCSMLSPNNCKIEKDVKFCYCSSDLCNFIHSDRSSLEPMELSPLGNNVWRKEEADDEDLLGPSYPHNPLDILNYEEMQGDSGSGEHPPGVIRIETTTIKPTLVPNLRADSRTTVAPTSSIASSSNIFSVWGVCVVFYIIL